MKKEIKTFQITLSVMIIGAFLLMPLALNAQAGKVNFSGTWALNADKSNFGQAPQGGGQPGQGGGFGGGMRMGGGNFTAKQEANLLTVDRTMPDMNGGTQTVSSKYTLDGKESVNSSAFGDAKSVSTWSADGKSLTIVTNRTIDRGGQTMEMKTTEVWSLTSPETLSIVSTRTTPNGERTTTMVYDKK